MDALKKPETILLAVVIVVLIGYIVYDYRKLNAHEESIDKLKEGLASTVRTVGNVRDEMKKMQSMAEEIISLKKRLEDMEEMKESFEELMESLEDLETALNEKGIEIELDLPELDSYSKKKKRGKKGKNKKRGKKKGKGRRGRDEESSSEEESSDEERVKSDAHERLSRLRARGKKGK